MSKVKAFIIGGVVGVSTLAMATVPAVSAFAWQPQGTIVKKIQNNTQNSGLSDANDVASAITAKPGDILTFVITVSNTQTQDDGTGDMTNTVMTDTLPAGLSLVSDSSQTTISENLGTIKPNQGVTKQYQVKVTSTKDNDVITNKSCFTGNSAVNDSPQAGCDVAVIKVSNPPAPTPTPTPTPSPTPTPAAPTTPAATTTPASGMPSTGPTSTITIALIAVAAGYLYRLRRLARQS